MEIKAEGKAVSLVGTADELYTLISLARDRAAYCERATMGDTQFMKDKKIEYTTLLKEGVKW